MEERLSIIRNNPNFKYFNEIHFYGDENPYIIVKNLSIILTNILKIEEYKPPNMIKNEYINPDHLAFLGNLIMTYIKFNGNNINDLENIIKRKEYYKDLYIKTLNELEEYKEKVKYYEYILYKKDNEKIVNKEDDDIYVDSKEIISPPTPSTSCNINKTINETKEYTNDTDIFNTKVHDDVYTKVPIVLSAPVETGLNQEEKDTKNVKIDKTENNTKNVESKKPEIKNKKSIKKAIDKSLPIMERFPVKIYKNRDIGDSEILQFVSSENCFMIEYQSKIADKLNKNIENITIDDVVNFKLKYDEINDENKLKKKNKSIKTKIKRLILRSENLYNKYGKKLCKFKISLNYLKEMSEEEWTKWLSEFDNIFNDVCKNETICNHKYKNGKECGRINCKIKHKEH